MKEKHHLKASSAARLKLAANQRLLFFYYDSSLAATDVWGDIITLEDIRNRYQLFELPKWMQHVFDTGNPFFYEFQLDSGLRYALRIEKLNSTSAAVAIVDIAPLSAKIESLKRTNEALERFSSQVAHDLKEPLQMVSMFTELLFVKNKDLLDPESKNFAQIIIDTVQRMFEQVNGLLNDSRLDLRSLHQPVDTNALLHSPLKNIKDQVQESDGL